MWKAHGPLGLPDRAIITSSTCTGWKGHTHTISHNHTHTLSLSLSLSLYSAPALPDLSLTLSLSLSWFNFDELKNKLDSCQQMSTIAMSSGLGWENSGEIEQFLSGPSYYMLLLHIASSYDTYTLHISLFVGGGRPSSIAATTKTLGPGWWAGLGWIVMRIYADHVDQNMCQDNGETGAYYCLNIQLFSWKQSRQDVQLNAVGLAFPWNQCKQKWVQWWCVMMCNIFTRLNSNSNTTQQ